MQKSFNINDIKNSNAQYCSILEQLEHITLPKELQNDKENWLKIIAKWLIDKIAIPVIEEQLKRLAEGIAKGNYKNFNINKINSFKSLKNFVN